MFRLVKYLVILKLLNPFHRGFSLIKFLCCLALAGGLLLHYGVPDWLGTMVKDVVAGQQGQTSRQPNRGGFGGYESRPGQSDSAGGILAGILGDGEKAAGGFLESILNRDKPAATPVQSEGGILSNILTGAFGPGKKSDDHQYGPPSDFSGGTVTANPRLFAAYANHGGTPAQIQALPDSPMPPTQMPSSQRWQTIQSVVDGDTLVVNGQKVRLIGIDAPEAGRNDHLARELDRIGAKGEDASMIYMGQSAANFVKRLAEGKRCWLESDGPERDQYGRVLAYVHLEDGTNLNEAILYQGYAKAYLGASFRYLKRYIFLQDEAARRGNGFWSAR